MALWQAPQHIALRDLEEIVARNNQNQQVMLMAVLAARRQEEEQQQARARRPRRWWVKPWVARRPLHGQYHHLFQELDEEFDMDYVSYMRVDRNMFAELIQRVGPRILKSQRWVQCFG